MSARIKQLVDAICEGDDDPRLREQAVRIAESQLWLSCIGAEKVSVLERLRDPEAMPLMVRRSRQYWAAIKQKVDIRFRAFEIADDQLVEVEALIAATRRAGRDPEREPLPEHLEGAWPPKSLRAHENLGERDEYQVMRSGIQDLEHLLRYEKRAWSRLKKAVRSFMAIKLTKRYESAPA